MKPRTSFFASLMANDLMVAVRLAGFQRGYKARTGGSDMPTGVGP